jgi:hypothetical protein
VPLPHPSWRNNGWLKRHPWFEGEVLPFVREEVRRLLSAGGGEESYSDPKECATALRQD